MYTGACTLTFLFTTSAVGQSSIGAPSEVIGSDRACRSTGSRSLPLVAAVVTTIPAPESASMNATRSAG